MQEIYGKGSLEDYGSENYSICYYSCLYAALCQRYKLGDINSLCDRGPAGKAGGSLAVSREAQAIDGGFVLVYGGMEENCSFSALFDANREDFLDAARAVLFGEG